MDLVFSDTTGDCVSFASPEPQPQTADRRRRRTTPEEAARILADRAIRLAPRPELEVSPDGKGLTGLRSYFWLGNDMDPVTATAQAGPVTVSAQARPVQYVWTFGDGAQSVTGTPGRRWTERRPGSVGHVYETRGLYHLVVEVIWEARWRIGAGAWEPLGYFTNDDSRPYRVRQVIAVLTGHR